MSPDSDGQTADDAENMTPDALSPEPTTLGGRLRAARVASGLSFVELSTKTRVNTRFLKAIEQGDQSLLPSRIFTMGYVRIYAQVLGLDELEAVEQYKAEFPEAGATLQAPTGAAFQEVRRRSSAILAIMATVGLAFLCWNIFQRLNRIEPPHPSDLTAIPAVWAKDADKVPQTALVLGGPQAAPPDQTTPPLYLTPGIEAQILGDDPGAVATATAPAPPVQAAFNPRGALYGAPANNSIITLQAIKPVTLVVRQGDGRVLFARQLAAGDSWRAPLNVQAVVDMSDPAVVAVYMNGELTAPLVANQTPLSRLNTQAGALARQAESRAAAAAEAEVRARNALAEQAAADLARATPSAAPVPAAPAPVVPQ
ncbi:helix-turn-helix domain-containing protein [Brevundimonas sp.]|uniref:helix-turn-helix domain-containing protein n=1 Tax=Brevundimonas sp. TaxID=1871086 RepID=UPI002FC7246E